MNVCCYLRKSILNIGRLNKETIFFLLLSTMRLAQSLEK